MRKKLIMQYNFHHRRVYISFWQMESYLFINRLKKFTGIFFSNLDLA